MGGSSQTPVQTTQVQKTELPAWVDNASQSNYALAQQVADRPFQQYEGPRVAGLTDAEKSAMPTLQAGMTGASSAYGSAGTALERAGAYTPQQVAAPSAVGDVTAKTIPQTDLSAYLNPFTQNVVDTTLAGMDRASAGALQANDDASRSQGAWGGSRSGVQQAVLQAENIRNKAATEAGLRSTAFNTATGLAQTDNASALSAALANQSKDTTANAQNIQVGTANQSAGLAAANLGLQAGTAQTALGDSITNAAGKNALLASQLGANERSVTQAGYDADAAKFQEAYDAPLTALNTRLAALGMSPYGKTTSTDETKSGGTSSNTALQVAGGAMSFLPLLFSDERLKKNVKTVGTTEVGVPLKEFEYKGFMGRKSPGKQIGVMAQDMEKVRPDAVQRVRGDDGKSYRAVDYSKVGRGFMGRKRAA